MIISHSTREGHNKHNEDCCKICQKDAGIVIALADGMGGRSYGDVVAMIVTDTICDYDWIFTDIHKSIEEAFAKADAAVAQKSEELHAKMGCAIGCLVIVDNAIYYAGLGDIRLYVVTKSGERHLLSEDDVLCGRDGHTFLARSIRGRGIKKPINVIMCTIDNLQECILCTDGYYNNDKNDDATIVEIRFV